MRRRNKIKRKKNLPENFFGRLIFYSATTVFFGILIYIFFFSPFLKIEKIEIFGLEGEQKSEIFSEIFSEMEISLLGNWKRDSYFLFRTASFSKKIEKKHSWVKAIRIRKIFPEKLVVEVIPRKPSLILESDGQYFLLDEEGTAYEKISLEGSNFFGEIFLMRDLAGRRNIEKGKSAVRKETVRFILETEESFSRESSLKLKKEVETPTPASSDFRFKSEGGFLILTDENISPEKTGKVLRAILLEEIGSEKISNLEYVDLRLENKVFYKFKNSFEEDSGGEVQ